MRNGIGELNVKFHIKIADEYAEIHSMIMMLSCCSHNYAIIPIYVVLVMG